MQELSVFGLIQLSFVAWAFWESYLEGDTGWTWNPKWWRINLPGGYTYTAYHVWAFWIFAPMVFLALPLVVAGFSWRLFWLLLASLLFGSIIEDFMWFVVNPCYPFTKWNPRETKWYPWLDLGILSLPVSYVIKFVLSAMILMFLFSKS